MAADGRPRFLECKPLPGLNPESSDIVILSRMVFPQSELAHCRLVQGVFRYATQRYGMTID